MPINKIPGFFGFSFAVLGTFVATLSDVNAAAIPGRVVALEGLDKVTGRVVQFEVPVGDVVSFGTFDVTAQTCTKTPPEELPETTAYLEIWDTPPGGQRAPVFSGWMFASSPGLSAVSHPVYDVWVVDCLELIQ